MSTCSEKALKSAVAQQPVSIIMAGTPTESLLQFEDLCRTARRPNDAKWRENQSSWDRDAREVG